MNSKDTTREDDPNEWPAYDHPAGPPLGLIGAGRPDGADQAHVGPRGLVGEPPSTTPSASASPSDDWGYDGFDDEARAPSAENASSDRHRPPLGHPAREAAIDDWDWAAGEDEDADAHSRAGSREAARDASAAPDDGHNDGPGQTAPQGDAEQAKPYSAKLKRSYGRAPRPATAAPTLLPLAHELDMFPAFMSRSALFSAIRAGSGGAHAGSLPAPKNVSLSLQGPRLSMADKRVWEALVRTAKRGRADMAAPFEVAMGDIAEMAGFERAQTRSAWAAIERLAAAQVDALVDGVPVTGRLLAWARSHGRRRVVAFDASFMEAALARVLNVDLAGSLRGRLESPLAQWLGDYFLTHEPSTTSPDLAYLRTLCGHPGAPKDFVAALEGAMAALAAARPDLIAGWSIDKSKRSSLAWTLGARRGDYRPMVKHPPKPKALPPATPTSLAAAAAAARRRGPAL